MPDTQSYTLRFAAASTWCCLLEIQVV